MLTRRQFCHGMGAGITASSLFPMVARGETGVNLGAMKVRSFSDGMMSVPTSMVFDENSPPEIIALLKQSGMGEGVAKRPLNVTLVESGERMILFDAGSGANFLPGLGKLPSALESAGIDLSAITDVVFTHAHPDHIWGILDDFDELAMPDATYHISRKEWDFWDSEETLAAMPEARKSFVVGAQARFDAFREQVSLFEFGAEILGGIEAVDSEGHTPGHASFAVHGKSESLMILGDALTHPLISFQYPEFKNNADHDKSEAGASRKALLERMHADNMRLIGYHLPAPGIGYVEKKGTRYRYVAT